MTASSSRLMAPDDRASAGLMRAAVVTAPGQVRIADAAVPTPRPSQVRIKLQGCGVCGSNIPVWEGRDWFTYPLEPGKPGHEGWGIVDAIGADVDQSMLGQRVGVLSYNAFAEYDVADHTHVVPLPAVLNDSPVPAEALGCAVNVFHRSGIIAGNSVAIVGFGFLGALVGQLAHSAGARVFALSRRASALAAARSLGIADTVPIGAISNVVDAVKAINAGQLCDVVVEAAGTQATLDLSAELTKERGRLVIAGFHQDGPRSINAFLWNWRGLDVINAHERDPHKYVDGMRAAIDALVKGILTPRDLYTHSFPLDQLADALTAAHERPEGFMKALVYM